MSFKARSDISHGIYVLFAAAVVGGAVVLLKSDSWILLILVGFTFAGFGSFKLYQTVRTKSWNKATGEIKSVDLGKFSVAETEYFRSTYYYPEVTFSYDVQGRRFESNTIAADIKSHWSKNRAEVESILARYAPGVTTTVYYNPGSPHESVILPGLSRYRISHYSAIIVGGILVALVGYMVGVYA